MSKISKKEIRQFIIQSGKQIFSYYKISSPSKKSEKILSGFSRKLAEEIKSLLKQKANIKVEKVKTTSEKKLARKSSAKTKPV